jgi:hypothetical protein
MRTVRASSAQDVLTSIWAELGRHRQPKLHAEHAGPIAKCLVEHPFRAALGIERIFHFETLADLGFAVLSGGKRVLSRSRLGGLVREVTTTAVKQLARATEQLGGLRGKTVTLSLDEHAIARFTRKLRMPKGFHTLRNKKVRIEKLVYVYWPERRRFVQLVGPRGNATLAALAVDVLRTLRRLVGSRGVWC